MRQAAWWGVAGGARCRSAAGGSPPGLGQRGVSFSSLVIFFFRGNGSPSFRREWRQASMDPRTWHIEGRRREIGIQRQVVAGREGRRKNIALPALDSRHLREGRGSVAAGTHAVRSSSAARTAPSSRGRGREWGVGQVRAGVVGAGWWG